jgi:APA family basic amino acid/polyamine antiporter
VKARVASAPAASHEAATLARRLGPYDAATIVISNVVGGGIFFIPVMVAGLVPSGWAMLSVWLVGGVLAFAGAMAYAELATLRPHAGGEYVYLREAFGPLWGFLYGWTLFMVIQTGTIAAVAVGFARYTGYLIPWFAEDHYIVAPIHVSTGYAFSLSTVQLLGIIMIALLTWTNTRGLDWGKVIQNVFTTT